MEAGMTGSLDDRIPEVIRRVSVAGLLADRGHEPARTNGGALSYQCPLPGHDDRNPSFTVKGERWKCWSQCDRSGDVIDLVVALDGCSKREAIDALGRQCGLERSEPRTTRRPGLSTARARELLDTFVEKRGWWPPTVAEVGLSVVIDVKGRPRVRFPYRVGNATVWYQDRLIGPGKPPWMAPKWSKIALFNVDSLRLAEERGEVFIVEGPSDVMAMLSTWDAPAVVGIPGVGAFLPAWVPCFAGLGRVYVVADNDEAGQKMRDRLDLLLGPVVGQISHVRVPEPFVDVDEWRRGIGSNGDFAEAFTIAAEGVRT